MAGHLKPAPLDDGTLGNMMAEGRVRPIIAGAQQKARVSYISLDNFGRK